VFSVYFVFFCIGMFLIQPSDCSITQYIKNIDTFIEYQLL